MSTPPPPEAPAVASRSTRTPAACAPDAFEARYRADPDPWDFAGSADELARYDALLEVVGPGPFASGYEPGCSIGVLTSRLAHRCERLRAVDVSPTAVARARERCAGRPGVTVEVASVADDRTGGHDLVVASEVGYYFAGPALDAVVEHLVDVLAPGGTLVACHWLGRSADHAVPGPVVHQRLARHPALHATAHRPGPTYVIDRWQKR